MKRIVGLMVAGLALAACGADGEPVTPNVSTTVSVGTGGVSTHSSVTVRQGPLILGVSL